jgi:hypothetical protein
MRNTLAQGCLVIAWLLALSSPLLLCDCPGYPAIGIPLAILAAWWLPTRRWRLASVLTLLACVFMTTLHAADKSKVNTVHQRTLARAAEKWSPSNTNVALGVASTNGVVLISTNQ